MKIFVVNINRDGTQVNQITLEGGFSKHIITIQGDNINTHAEIISVHILKHKPNKVFVTDNFGIGLRDILKNEMSKLKLELKNDATVIA